MERNILAAALHDRGAFEELLSLDIEDSLSDQGEIVWHNIKEYYQTDGSAKAVDRELLARMLERKHPKHGDMFRDLVTGMAETSTSNLLREVIEVKKEAVKLRLAQALSSPKDEKKIEPLWEEYERLQAGEIEADESSEILVAPDLKDIMESRSKENRIRLLPEALTETLEGGPLHGHHIVIYSVTDMGKTLMVLNMIRGFIEDGRKVLYVCNEDPVSDLIERFLVSLTGRLKEQVRKHWDKAQEVAEKKGWHNLIWASMAPGTIPEIRALIEKYEPEIIVVDQIRNLDCGEKNFVRTLEIAAQCMRQFAKKYNILAISVTQAGDSANGKAVLGRGDIDNSNVGIPGTADLMLGVGANQDQEFDGIRTLSFAKNKISGVKTPIQVLFNSQTMRID